MFNRRHGALRALAVLLLVASTKGGRGDGDESETEIEDYSTYSDYNDVVDGAGNGTVETESSVDESPGSLKFVDGLTNLTKDEGDPVHMRCKVVGDPPPTRFQWFKDKVALVGEQGRILIRKIPAQGHDRSDKKFSGTRLKINRLQTRDKGLYTCRIGNGKDQIESSGLLTVDVETYDGGKIEDGADPGDYVPAMPHFSDLLDEYERFIRYPVHKSFDAPHLSWF